MLDTPPNRLLFVYNPLKVLIDQCLFFFTGSLVLKGLGNRRIIRE